MNKKDHTEQNLDFTDQKKNKIYHLSRQKEIAIEFEL